MSKRFFYYPAVKGLEMRENIILNPYNSGRVRHFYENVFKEFFLFAYNFKLSLPKKQDEKYYFVCEKNI